jgi:hypothetical protein
MPGILFNLGFGFETGFDRSVSAEIFARIEQRATLRPTCRRDAERLGPTARSLGSERAKNAGPTRHPRGWEDELARLN